MNISLKALVITGILAVLAGVGSAIAVAPYQAILNQEVEELISPVPSNSKPEELTKREGDLEIHGFFPYWLLGKVSRESLDAVDEAVYFALEISEDGSIQEKLTPQELEPGWNAFQKDLFASTLAKRSSPIAKTSLLVHLSSEKKIDQVLEKPQEHAQNLMDDVIPLMKDGGFKDLNLDIESFIGASPEKRDAMIVFFQTVKDELVENKAGTLTIELTVPSLTKQHLIDPIRTTPIADFLVLMAYDYHYRDSYVSGPVAPVGGAEERWSQDVAQSLDQLLAIAPPEKVLLGIPLYGYEWETLSGQPLAPTIPGTGKTATLARITTQKSECTECQEGREPLSQSPYIVFPPSEESAFQHIFYEDSAALTAKLELAEDRGIKGVAFWAMGYENEILLKPLSNF